MAADVLIVGAGLAGLSCALELYKAGIEFEIIEASERVGGRVKTDVVDGFLLDRGFQIFLTAYPEAARILDYDALNFKRFIPGALVRAHGKFSVLADPWREPLRALETVMAPVGSIPDKFKMLPLRQKVLAGGEPGPFENTRTTEKALEGFGFSPEMIDGFFRPFFSGIFLEPKLNTSASVFRFVFQMLASGDNVLPARGMEEIPKQLASKLPSSSFRFNSPAVSVADRTVVLNNGEQRTASAIVVATDELHAGKLLGEPRQAKFNSQTCLYFSADEAPINDPILVLNSEKSGPINNLCVPSNVSDQYAPEGKALISACAIGQTYTNDFDLVAATRAQLRNWFGATVDDWKHLRTYVIPYALPNQEPASVANNNHHYLLANSIFRCGDYMENGSINGALLSGRKCAERILANGL